MYCIQSENTDSYFNLATEEFLLKNSADNFFLLWRSSPSVIIGKHQNAYAEINLPYVLKNKIQVARRLSGGGTVVHDMGNLNFTFIMNGEKGKLVDFKKFLKPVIDFLNHKGLAAYIGEKNDIRIGDYKISGNAEHVYKQRTLHHGTLLYNSDLNQLRQAIHIEKKKYFDKAVQSNRSEVVNIADLLTVPESIKDIELELFHYVQKIYAGRNYSISKTEQKEIENLLNEKYCTPDWIFAYSPKHYFENKGTYGGGEFDISFSVDRGIIQNTRLKLNGICTSQLEILENKINGMKHFFIPMCNMIHPIFPDWSTIEVESFAYNFF